MRAGMWQTWLALGGLLALPQVTIASEPTEKHEAGRCAFRGQCASTFFGGSIPCVDNDLAKAPSDEERDELVEVCGDEWENGDVCCTGDQIQAMQSNLQRVRQIVGTCPACKKNFYDMICTFTCSPDQSLFVNVTSAAEKSGKLTVDELDHLVSDEYGSGLFDSCKEVKVAGTKAMNLIGGGAKNYTAMLAFVGQKSSLGSPFQMNFPRPSEGFPEMKTILDNPKECNSSDERYRCLCVDCPDSCPKPPEIQEESQCSVGLLPCLSFAIIIIYAVFVTLLVLAISGHIAAAKRRQSKNERLQLLHDVTADDEDDGRDVVHSAGGLLDRPTKKYAVNEYCDRAFSSLARACAKFPAITIGSSIVVVALLCLGWIRFEVETDPVKLWVAPDSAAAQEKQFFDESFGPFFRTEQAFLVNDTLESGPNPVLSYDTLRWWFDVERRIRNLKSPNGYTWEDVCYRPTGDACILQSISQYSGFNELDPDTWQDDLEACAKEPINCPPDFKQPLPISRLLGGYNESSESLMNASALIATWVVKNYNPGAPELARAEDWEYAVKRQLRFAQSEAAERGLRLSFNTEPSLEEELNKNTNTDAKIVVISYIVMFIYASLALGGTTVTASMIVRNPLGAIVQSKFMLGVVGIVIVLMSVAASVGLFAAVGVKASLIIAEVIPFLVLAVGVDNIFLIVHEFERVNISHADEPVSERIARALGRMGPSILLSATCETVAFALGAAVGMPAVRNFAAYAAGAVFINALLQVTMFVSVLTLNQRRVESGRADCFPCVKLQSSADSDMPNGYGGAPFSGVEEEGFLTRFIRKYYAPTLLGNRVRIAIMTVFLGLFAAGIALLPEVQLGLDQRIAIPSDSYLIDYFNDLEQYFGEGPPVYFVVRSLNATARPHQKELCAGFTTCNEYSVAATLELERKRPEQSYISDASADWLDDFLWWLNPEVYPTCCLNGATPCFENREPAWDLQLHGMPQGEEFIYYLKRWLNSQPDVDCPRAGQAAFSDAIVVDNSSLTIPASHYRTAHTPLRSSPDFINSYAAARRIANDISEKNNIDVFPYSKHYIFFDQYTSIVQVSTALVGIALACIFVLVSALLGSIATGFVVTITVAMIVIDIVGTMTLAGVSLNAVSLVNIIICVGIGLEFCAHIARAYTVPSASILERAQTRFRGKEARAWAALVNVGGSVFSGITITKLLGVFVLAFTRSKIFEIYYFRIWLALVVWAALHALIFLPVALSFLGGTGYVDPESDGGLEQDLASRRYRALLPDDEYDSDDY